MKCDEAQSYLTCRVIMLHGKSKHKQKGAHMGGRAGRGGGLFKQWTTPSMGLLA